MKSKINRKICQELYCFKRTNKPFCNIRKNLLEVNQVLKKGCKKKKNKIEKK